MSDYQDFCEGYGGSSNDPDFMDNLINENGNKGVISTKRKEIKTSSALISKHGLSSNEWMQIKAYVSIYIKYTFKEHYEVNNYINKNKLWSGFPDIRSINDHGSHKNIPGIMPKYYAIVCEILDITGASGLPLTKANRY